MATLCALSRVVLGAHYVSDVIAGTLGYWFAHLYDRFFGTIAPYTIISRSGIVLTGMTV